jgi:hypothetical protein
MDVDYKAPGGKLIRISADVRDEIINSVQITGDFFVHPETSIESLERELKGVPLKRQVIQRICYRELSKCELVGLTPGDVAHALMKLQSDSL